MTRLPGGPLATRPLHFVFLADASGSMQGEKIASLNFAIRDAIPHMREVAKGNPNAEVLVRAIRFANDAKWHHMTPTKVEQYDWTDLSADGCTAMGKALELVADALSGESMPHRALPPVLVLVTDGEPTDDFDRGLARLMSEPWGKKAVRLAIAIGDGANLAPLRRFIGHGEIEPMRANNAEQLVQHIRWASTAVLQAASAPASQTPGSPAASNVPLPPPPAPPLGSADDVW